MDVKAFGYDDVRLCRRWGMPAFPGDTIQNRTSNYRGMLLIEFNKF